MENYEKTCVVCGKDFIAHKSFAKYCSERCRGVQRRRKQSCLQKYRSHIAEKEEAARKQGLHYADLQKQKTISMVGSVLDGGGNHVGK